MYTPYLLIMTMFSGAAQIIDPEPFASLASCEAELVRMRAAVEDEWAEHGIVRMEGECRDYDPDSWGRVPGNRSAGLPALAAGRH